MESLGIAVNIAAAVDLSAKVATLCFQYSTAVASARADITRLQNYVNRLATALRAAKQLIEGPNSRPLAATHELAESLQICTDELRKLRDKLGANTEHESMRRFGIRALKWPFNHNEIEGIITNLERYESTILLSLQIDQTNLLLNISERIEGMSLQAAQDMSIARNAPFITSSYEGLLLPVVGLAVPKQLALLPGYIPIIVHDNHSEKPELVGVDDISCPTVCGQVRPRIKAAEGIQLPSTSLQPLMNELGAAGSRQAGSNGTVATCDLAYLSSSHLSPPHSTFKTGLESDNTITPPTSRRNPLSRCYEEFEVYDDAKTYYSSPERHYNRAQGRSRTYTQNNLVRRLQRIGLKEPFRRSSHNEFTNHTYRRQFLISVDLTLKTLREKDGTDRNIQITICDNGPKVLTLRTAASGGLNRFDIRGAYMISNLLQELTLAKKYGRKQIILDEARLEENPVDRLSRLIRDCFWESLTRQIDSSAIDIAVKDPKDWTEHPRPRIYVPAGAPEQFELYQQLAKDRPGLRLDVQRLPERITPQLVRDLNDRPGRLALAMEKVRVPETGEEILKGLPFVVPGGKSNDLYGWDSYMTILGLLSNGKAHLAKSMVLNFCFCIQHYGMILNATRSYYLCQSQPPFLTDMALRVYEKIKNEPDAKNFLRTALSASIKEYHCVWVAEPRLDPITGLSRYRPEGLGVPPEIEVDHFAHVLEPYAKRHGMTLQDFVKALNAEEIKEPELDEYFLHDRAIRESGQNASRQLEGVYANLATIDLNSLLFKYETDIARTIRTVFGDKLVIAEEFGFGTIKPGSVQHSAMWDRKGKRRKLLIDKYLWNEDKGMYFDYDTVKKEQTMYESATTFLALWAGVSAPRRAVHMVLNALPKFESYGGLLSGTEKPRGELELPRSNRRWDFPYGWAPQQMIAWIGLLRYSFTEEAERLAYKWLFMITKTFVNFNDAVVEKNDVSRPANPHRVDVEYGNHGLDFQSITEEGFGCVNASYVYGLAIINTHMRRALGTLTPYETFSKAISQLQEDFAEHE